MVQNQKRRPEVRSMTLSGWVKSAYQIPILDCPIENDLVKFVSPPFRNPHSAIRNGMVPT